MTCVCVPRPSDERGGLSVPVDTASATPNPSPFDTLGRMPTFDVVSEVDAQEVRNAVDQAQREIANRFDFKNTNSTIEQNEMVITLAHGQP